MILRNEIRLYAWELESMPEYSLSLPTGQTPWKQWRRNVNVRRLEREPEWVVGQYVPSLHDGYVGIRWSRVVLRHGPRPRLYRVPDWSRVARFEARS